MLQAQLAEQKKREMIIAAQALLEDYQTDRELTAFTALDSEEVK